MSTEDSVTRRYLVRRPKALQFFHNGHIQKASDGERQAGRFELFLDLLYVALVANFAENFAEHPNGAGLVRYILIFSPAWHAWSDLRELMNSYYNDDLLQRCLILWIMALLILYGNNAPLVSEDIGAMRATVGAYMVARLTMMLTYWIYSFASTEHRPQARVFASLNFVGLFIWVPLLISEEHVSLRAKIAVTVIAIIYEEVVWIFSFGPWIKRILKLKISTAVDVDHEVDRQAAFYIIVLGEYVYGIVVGSPAAVGLQLKLFRAVETLIIAFSLNWIYVNLDGSIVSTHPLQRSVTAAFVWFLIHLPLAASLLIGGHVAAVSVGAEDLEPGLRWIMCGGLGAGLLCLWIIGELHQSEDPAGKIVFPKHVRMAPRLVCAIILACIPLAENLDPTQLLSVVTGLFLFIVVWETVGSLERCAKLVESWKDESMDEDEAMDEAVDETKEQPAATDE